MRVMPYLPTLAEQGLADDAYRLTVWVGIAVPAGCEPAVVTQIASAIHAAVHLPDVKSRLESMGFEAQDSSPDKLSGVLRRELPMVEQLMKRVGIRPQQQ